MIGADLALLEIAQACDAIVASFCAELDRASAQQVRRAEKYEAMARGASRKKDEDRRGRATEEALHSRREIASINLAKETALSLMVEDLDRSVALVCRFFRRHSEVYISGFPACAEDACVRLKPLAEQLSSLLHIYRAYPESAAKRAKMLVEKAKLAEEKFIPRMNPGRKTKRGEREYPPDVKVDMVGAGGDAQRAAGVGKDSGRDEVSREGGL